MGLDLNAQTDNSLSVVEDQSIVVMCILFVIMTQGCILGRGGEKMSESKSLVMFAIQSVTISWVWVYLPHKVKTQYYMYKTE